MTHQVTWRKSSYSGADNGNCVELANLGAVRDSKNPTGPMLAVNLTEFLTAVKTGHLDH